MFREPRRSTLSIKVCSALRGGITQTCIWQRPRVTAPKQELAVEDMRLELDDEGRRELEEEQGDGEGESGSKADGRFAQLANSFAGSQSDAQYL